MTDVTIKYHAPEGEIIGPHAFASQIGINIPLRTPKGDIPATLLAAEIDANGMAASLTLRLPDNVGEELLGQFRFDTGPTTTTPHDQV